MKHLLVVVVMLLLTACGGGADPVFQTSDFVDQAPGELNDAATAAPAQE